MNIKFDVDALFVVTKEVFSTVESKIINPNFMIDYLNSVRLILDSIREVKKDLSSDGLTRLRRFEEDIKRLSGLNGDVEEINELDQDDLESQFNNWVSTPQLVANSDSFKIVRKNLPNYDELRSRIEWGKTMRIVYNNATKNWAPASTLVGKITSLKNRIEKFKLDFPELGDLTDELSEIITSVIYLKGETLDIGIVETPVGYVMNAEGKYELDTTYLISINDNLDKLKSLKDTLQDELKPLLLHEINQSIKALSSIKEKYIKNRMIDIILQVITDENNKFRMMTPISFEPLTRAIELIDKNLVPATTYDLSSATDAFKAYQALSSGMILTGAFANASKSFGYFARAGASKKVIDYYKLLSQIDKHLSNIGSVDQSVYEEIVTRFKDFIPEFKLGTEISDWSKEFRRLKSALINVDRQVNRTSFAKVNTSPTLNPLYQFTISLEDSKILLFDKLATMDARDKYSVTAVYDALTNEAIDNLKLGDLVKARINTNTGSTTVGLVSVGVPMDYVVKLFYQPIFAPLSTGKINRVDSWVSQIRKDHKEILTKLEYETLSINELNKFLGSDYHKFQNMSFEQMTKILTQEELIIQLKAFNLFTKGYKIGEDMRAASTFLNLIRKHDVFIEDILQLDDDLANKIGSIDKVDEQLVLTVHPLFSFIIPNLFESAPHIKEAYLAHEDVKTLISGNIKIHSPQITEFSDKVYRDLNVLKKEEGERAQTSKANIRRSLAHYVLAGLINESEIDAPNSTVKVGNYTITLSKLRSFSNKVANDIWKIKQFADADNNYFLKNISIIRDSYSVSSIGFKSGVNLNPEDVRNITLGFKLLNGYGINENGDPIRLTVNNPNQVSKLQKDLLNYAVLNYGLQFSNSNFSNYINIQMLKDLDIQYNQALDQMISDINQNN